MAIIASKTKQPWEALRISIDYSAEIGALTLDSLTADVAVPDGMTLLGQTTDGGRLQIYIGGGTDGQVYHWRIRTTIVAGAAEIARVEDEVVVLVEEVVGAVDSPDGAFTAAGATAARIEQTDGESIAYLIDCRPLLRRHELLTAITTLTPSAGLTATGAVLRQGQYLEVTLAGTADAGPAYTDRVLRVLFASTAGAVRAAITLRVYAAD